MKKSSRLSCEKFKSKKFWLTILLLSSLLVTLPVAAVFGSDNKPIKIGGVLPLTGWGAAEGSYVKFGAEIAVDLINSTGGVNGRQLELLVEDGKNDPSESLTACQKLVIRDKVSVMFGAWLSSATLAMIPTVERYGVPLIVETSGFDGITHPAKKWVFRTSILFSQEAASVEPHLMDLGFTHVAFLAQDNDWGRGTVEEFSKVIKKQGGKIGSVDYLDAATTDFYPQLTKIKASDANAIIVVNSTPAASKLIQQAYELGLKQKLMTTGGSTWPYSIVRLAGAKEAEGTYHLSFFPAFAPECTPNPELSKKYVAEWKKRDLTWDGVQEGSRGFDAVMTIVEGIKLADGSDKPAKIRDGLEKIDFMGITGHIKFDEFHDQQPNIVVVQVRDGKPTVPSLK